MLYFRVTGNLDQIPSRQELLRLKILDQMEERSQKSTRILKKAELETLQGKGTGRFILSGVDTIKPRLREKLQLNALELIGLPFLSRICGRGIVLPCGLNLV